MVERMSRNILYDGASGRRVSQSGLFASVKANVKESMNRRSVSRCTSSTRTSSWRGSPESVSCKSRATRMIDFGGGKVQTIIDVRGNPLAGSFS